MSRPSRRYAARYRKASIKRWQEPEFRKLSTQPSAKLLLLFLEQGPHTTPLPGVFSAGPAALAESLGWKPAELVRVFGELQAAGFARADWEAPLVWLPDSMRDFNAPDNRNVFKAWCTTFNELPDCPLKDAVESAIGNFLDIMAKGAAHEATDDESRQKAVGRRLMAQAWGAGLGDRMPDGMPTQEKEKEKDQEQAQAQGKESLRGRGMHEAAVSLSASASSPKKPLYVATVPPK